MSTRILVTGVAGFIGYHLAKELLQLDYEVIGVDNLNDYYDPELKKQRLTDLYHRVRKNRFQFVKIDIKDISPLHSIFETYRPEYVVHLAAQAGVRYSLVDPYAYVDSNLVGFMNVLEGCRYYPVKHLLYASSSSVYGGSKAVPFSPQQNVDHPVSLYAATKKSNELMAHAYSHLYGIPTTGLRFFTVYGPWGRPDMAYFSFTKRIIEGKPIRVFNYGNMERDFTYIDDVVQGVCKLLERAPSPNPFWDEAHDSVSTSFAPYKIYNIGNNQPISLMRFIQVLEEKIGRKAEIILEKMQPGDVLRTYADVSDLDRDIGFRPSTSIEEGLARFVTWYKEYYRAAIL
jgi:UDP-glucuronate 4-epimerase